MATDTHTDRLAEVAEALREIGQRVLALQEEIARERAADLRERRDEQLRGRWGSTAPEKIDLPLFLRAIPGLAARFDRVVPPEFVTATETGEPTVRCPCGETTPAASGKLVDCKCGRWFLNDGTKVHVACSPAD